MILLGLLAAGTVAASDLLWSVDLETDDGGLLSYGQTGQWEWGEATSGPKGGYVGDVCWATQLGGWYLNDSTDHLELDSLPLGSATRPVLVFWHWYRFQGGDYGTLELRRDGTWESAEPIYGYPEAEGYSGVSDGWMPAYLDLSGLGDADAMRFTLTADATGAALGWYLDELELWDGDPVPPQLELGACLEDTEDQVGPYELVATALDDVVVPTVELVYSVDGQPEQSTAMMAMGDDSWVGSIPGQAVGSTVSYSVQASDGENLTVSPDVPCSFEVRLAAPTQLQGPSGVVWGTHAPLSWEPPESAFVVQTYRVYRDDHLVDEVEETQTEAPVVTREQSFAVTAVYEAGEGSPSESITVEAAVPALTGLEPDQGYQGDQLRLRIEGDYLLLLQDDLEVDLGDGVRVNEYDVRDVDLAFVTIFIAATAPAGLRSLTLWTGEQQLEVVEAFEVLSGDERPQLTGVEPEAVRQGDETSLVISASDAFADLPSVWLGEHILVESVELTTADTLTVDIVVPYDTPLGLQDLQVDDGTRIFGGLNLQVRDYIAPVDPDGRCSSLPRRGGGLSLLIGLIALALRRRS